MSDFDVVDDTGPEPTPTPAPGAGASGDFSVESGSPMNDRLRDIGLWLRRAYFQMLPMSMQIGGAVAGEGLSPVFGPALGAGVGGALGGVVKRSLPTTEPVVDLEPAARAMAENISGVQAAARYGVSPKFKPSVVPPPAEGPTFADTMPDLVSNITEMAKRNAGHVGEDFTGPFLAELGGRATGRAISWGQQAAAKKVFGKGRTIPENARIRQIAEREGIPLGAAEVLNDPKIKAATSLHIAKDAVTSADATRRAKGLADRSEKIVREIISDTGPDISGEDFRGFAQTRDMQGKTVLDKIEEKVADERRNFDALITAHAGSSPVVDLAPVSRAARESQMPGVAGVREKVGHAAAPASPAQGTISEIGNPPWPRSASAAPPVYSKVTKPNVAGLDPNSIRRAVLMKDGKVLAGDGTQMHFQIVEDARRSFDDVADTGWTDKTGKFNADTGTGWIDRPPKEPYRPPHEPAFQMSDFPASGHEVDAIMAELDQKPRLTVSEAQAMKYRVDDVLEAAKAKGDTYTLDRVQKISNALNDEIERGIMSLPYPQSFYVNAGKTWSNLARSEEKNVYGQVVKKLGQMDPDKLASAIGLNEIVNLQDLKKTLEKAGGGLDVYEGIKKKWLEKYLFGENGGIGELRDMPQKIRQMKPEFEKEIFARNPAKLQRLKDLGEVIERIDKTVGFDPAKNAVNYLKEQNEAVFGLLVTSKYHAMHAIGRLTMGGIVERVISDPNAYKLLVEGIKTYPKKTGRGLGLIMQALTYGAQGKFGNEPPQKSPLEERREASGY